METKIFRSLLTSIFLGKFWNSLTFPWLFSFFLNFPDWKCNSLTFPWPGKFFIFQNFFPDHGNPVYCTAMGIINVFAWAQTTPIGTAKETFWAQDCKYFLTRQFKHVLGAQKNRLIEMVLLSTHNIGFVWEIRIFIKYPLLTGGLLAHSSFDQIL